MKNMERETKQVLSVSRRTDIPAFYMPWFMDRVNRGMVEVVNPFNRRIRQVHVSPSLVHTMVFWSKDFGPFLQQRCGERLQAMGYRLFFNFTVNSRSTILEPGVPPLNQRLDQLRRLCDRFGAGCVQWRFDPICHYLDRDGKTASNTHDFESIAAVAGACGIEGCITSFMDFYGKIKRRTKNRLTLVSPSMDERAKILSDMEKTLAPFGIRLNLCCENEVLERLPHDSTVVAGACISGRRIMAVHGGRVSLKQDTGQRKKAGCRCTVSVDVGSYDLHPCHHNCLFCYANPACDKRR